MESPRIGAFLNGTYTIRVDEFATGVEPLEYLINLSQWVLIQVKCHNIGVLR
jgi:hypothetical protein